MHFGWGRRHGYAAIGAALAIAIARGLATRRYMHVALATTATLALLGYALGAREDELRESSLTDPLTRVANRRHFEQALAEEIARAQRSHMPLALIVLDLDHLKSINDTLGHAAGDAALRALAQTIDTTTRSRDLTARFGGDEFVIVMPRTRALEAWSLAERIRASLGATWSRTSAYADRARLTVSAGIAELDLAEANALFDAADRALIAAKNAGRDRSIVSARRARAHDAPCDPKIAQSASHRLG